VQPDVAFVLTVVYIVLTIISPDQFGPEWASYHVLRYLAAIIFLASLPGIFNNLRFRLSIQASLILGFIVAIAASQVANGWYGGVIESWQVFLPSAAVFFFIAANVTTVRRLKILILTTVASCVAVVVEALCGYYGGFRGEMFVMRQNLYLNDDAVGQISRLRGAGFLNDPNDFAQILLIALLLLFIAWQRRQMIANLLFVIVPAVLLVWTIYLTHSRGALIALGVVALMAARKRIGTTASVVLATVLVFGLLAANFTGGRGISAVDGADRLEAWANGLEMLKTAPLFGIGFGSFTDFNEVTAHNSFILCLAELGLVGATLWVASLVTTMTGLNRIIREQEEDDTEPILAENAEREEEAPCWEASSFFHQSDRTAETPTASAADIETTIENTGQMIVPKNWAVVMRLALIAFIATGWFLSRSYQPTMYLVLGLATATIALERPATQLSIRNRWVLSTLAVEAAAIMVIYGIVKLGH
jgi:putative inorganic carbon (hco3(-)) transporter